METHWILLHNWWHQTAAHLITDTDQAQSAAHFSPTRNSANNSDHVGEHSSFKNNTTQARENTEIDSQVPKIQGFSEKIPTTLKHHRKVQPQKSWWTHNNNASNSEKVYLHRKPNIRTSIQKTHTHKLETGLLHGSYKRFTPKRNIARPRAQETEHQNQYTKKKTNTS